MVGPLRQSMLSVLAVALLMAFSGCLGAETPAAEAAVIDALTGSDETELADESTAAETEAEPLPAPAPEAARAEAPVAPTVSESAMPGQALVGVAAEATFVPAPSNQVHLSSLEQVFGVKAPKPAAAGPIATPDPGVDVDPPEVELPAGTLVDSFKGWAMSLTGGFEYALGCQGDGLDCAYFALPAAAQGQEFTMDFGAAVPPAAYFIDFYAGSEYIGTFGDGLSSLPIPGFTHEGHGSFTGVVPAEITELRAYAAGGADFVAHLVIGETDCPTDRYAIGSPTAELYATPFDNVFSGPGATWVYLPDGSNGEPGLQRNDDTFGTTCATGDAWFI